MRPSRVKQGGREWGSREQPPQPTPSPIPCQLHAAWPSAENRGVTLPALGATAASRGTSCHRRANPAQGQGVWQSLQLAWGEHAGEVKQSPRQPLAFQTRVSLPPPSQTASRPPALRTPVWHKLRHAQRKGTCSPAHAMAAVGHQQAWEGTEGRCHQPMEMGICRAGRK